MHQLYHCCATVILCLSNLCAFGQAFTLRDVPSLANASRSASAPLSVPTFVRAATNASGSASSLTISSFSVTGSNPYLLVMEVNNSTLTARTVTSITANGAAMSLLVNTQYVTRGNCYIYGLANPTSGDVVCTLSGTANSGVVLHAVLLNGAATTGAVAANFSNSARTSVSDDVSPTVTSDLVVDFTVGATWAGGGSQSQVSSAGTILSTVTTLTGASGTTTMSESGANNIVSHLVATVHGL